MSLGHASTGADVQPGEDHISKLKLRFTGKEQNMRENLEDLCREQK